MTEAMPSGPSDVHLPLSQPKCGSQAPAKWCKFITLGARATGMRQGEGGRSLAMVVVGVDFMGTNFATLKIQDRYARAQDIKTSDALTFCQTL